MVEIHRMSRAVPIALVCFLHATLAASVAIAELTSGDFAFDHPVASGHLRIMTWNLEVFNQRNANPQHAGNPNGPRTDDQLDELAARIVGFDASIIALQEMNQASALFDLRDRMNRDASGPWKVVAQFVTSEQQNAFLYNDDHVDLLSSDFYGETQSQFRATYSDHYPVFVDYRFVNVPEPNTVAVILMSNLLLFRRRRYATPGVDPSTSP